MNRIREILRFAAALVFLHVLATWTYGWSTGTWIPSVALVHPDLVLLLSFGWVVGLRRGYRAWVAHVITGVLLWLVVVRTARSITLDHYGRDVDLYQDLFFNLEGLWIYMTSDLQSLALLGVLVGGGLLIALLWWLVFVAVRVVLRSPGSGPGAWVALAVAQAGVLVLWLELSQFNVFDSSIFAASELRVTGAQCARVLGDQPWRERRTIQDRIAAAAAERQAFSENLAKLDGAHVAVLFLESYGRVVYRVPATRQRLAEAATGWAKTLRSAGYEACTGYTTSPVFGGNSHVAHASLLTGIPVDNKSQFEVLLDLEMSTMAHVFGAAGYHTVHVQPKLMQEWPRGAFFGFDKDFFGLAADYAAAGGERYHWGDGPDQYYLQKLWESEIRASEKPVFIEFISTTSHAPFKLLPPYLEDWSAAGDVTKLRPARRFDLDHWNYLQRPEHVEALVEVLRYSMDCAVGFAERLGTGDHPALLVVLGDHQPPAMKAGRRTLDVPMHIFSNRPALLEPFLKRGFVPGLVPPVETETRSFPMHRILPRLLRDFSR